MLKYQNSQLTDSEHPTSCSASSALKLCQSALTEEVTVSRYRSLERTSGRFLCFFFFSPFILVRVHIMFILHTLSQNIQLWLQTSMNLKTNPILKMLCRPRIINDYVYFVNFHTKDTILSVCYLVFSYCYHTVIIPYA